MLILVGANLHERNFIIARQSALTIALSVLVKVGDSPTLHKSLVLTTSIKEAGIHIRQTLQREDQLFHKMQPSKLIKHSKMSRLT